MPNEFELSVGEATKIPNGEHAGKVLSVNKRTFTAKDGSEGAYFDLIIELQDVRRADGMKASIRDGIPVPEQITENNKLGKTFKAMGYDLKLGSKLNVKDLEGKACKVITKNEAKKNADGSKGGEFAKVLDTIYKA
jgi:hypothetical protein